MQGSRPLRAGWLQAHAPNDQHTPQDIIKFVCCGGLMRCLVRHGMDMNRRSCAQVHAAWAGITSAVAQRCCATKHHTPASTFRAIRPVLTRKHALRHIEVLIGATIATCATCPSPALPCHVDVNYTALPRTQHSVTSCANALNTNPRRSNA